MKTGTRDISMEKDTCTPISGLLRPILTNFGHKKFLPRLPRFPINCFKTSSRSCRLFVELQLASLSLRTRFQALPTLAPPIYLPPPLSIRCSLPHNIRRARSCPIAVGVVACDAQDARATTVLTNTCGRITVARVKGTSHGNHES